MQNSSHQAADLYSRFFHDKRVPVYVPFSRKIEIMPDEGAWFPVKQCLWNGPRCLKVHFSTADIDPSCKRLFTEVLGVSDASMKEIIFEAVLFKKTDDLGYMRDIFLELEKFLEKDETYTVRLQSLNGKEIGPVTETMGPGEFEEVLSTKADRFIADTQPLHESFTSIIPLLAFATDDIE
jgi:hypothetical protein